MIFLMSFWVRAHIAVNSVVMAPKHNVIDWLVFCDCGFQSPYTLFPLILMTVYIE